MFFFLDLWDFNNWDKLQFVQNWQNVEIGEIEDIKNLTFHVFAVGVI
jgi:hypothetical protein